MNEGITRVVFRKWFAGAILAPVVTIVALMLLPGVSHALTDEQKALVGLKGVEVRVAKISPEAERLGLTKEQIQTDVELRLREAGVRLLTGKERLETPGRPYLYVRLSSFFEPDSCTYWIHVSLNEMVTLYSGFQVRGAIWSGDSVGSLSIERIPRIPERVGDRVDEFIKDYLAANPKK